MSPRQVNRADITLVDEAPRVRRRRLWWVAAIVVVAIVVELLIYLPSKVTLSQKQLDFKGFVTTIQQDIGGCAVALPDGYDALKRIHSGHSADLKVAKVIVNQDESYCTVAVNSDLFNLATLAPPNSLAHYNLSPIVADAYAWAYPGATAILYDSQILLTQPNNRSVLADMKNHLTAMRRTIVATNAKLAQVSAQLGLPRQQLSLDGFKGMPSYLRAQVQSS
ncbi:MAG: hypothetical protein ACYDHP_01720 [Ferrimicrobium sp.]